jgi:putative SOS response-associated peptidase YedK
MCGRLAQKLPSSRLVDMYRITPLKANVPPNYNVAPTQTSMVVCAHPEKMERELAIMQWGLIPAWSKSGKMEFATFNAKSETVATAASYRSAFKSRRASPWSYGLCHFGISMPRSTLSMNRNAVASSIFP